jgi:hypothetical protein
MNLYAHDTGVSVDRSKTEIERILNKYGAKEFLYGAKEGQAVIGFKMNGRRLRFDLPIPLVDDMLSYEVEYRGRKITRTRQKGAAAVAQEKEERRRWRALSLAIKAKLEAVASGITLFDEEFLAHFVLPDGKTVGQHAIPHVNQAYETGKVPPLLGFSSDDK